MELIYTLLKGYLVITLGGLVRLYRESRTKEGEEMMNQFIEESGGSQIFWYFMFYLLVFFWPVILARKVTKLFSANQ